MREIEEEVNSLWKNGHKVVYQRDFTRQDKDKIFVCTSKIVLIKACRKCAPNLLKTRTENTNMSNHAMVKMTNSNVIMVVT